MIRPLSGLALLVFPSSNFTSSTADVKSQRVSPRSRSAARSLAKILVSIALLGATVAVVILRFDTTNFFSGIHQLSIAAMASILTALLMNVFAAALRLKIITTDIGSPLSFRQALAAVSGGNLAGAAFFQIAGQLMARGVIMARSGVPFASVVVVTAYERIVAAVLSGFLALAGANYIFGNIIVDQYSGGDQLIKIIVGLIAAVGAGALVGHGKLTALAIAPFMSRQVATRFLRVSGLSFLVQLPMMAAYVLAAHALSPQTPITDIAAASAIVMFAASVPVSFAGWGVRELSAVVALGTIGVGVTSSLMAAIIVGAGSMFVMAAVAIVSLRRTIMVSQTQTSTRGSIDYTGALVWILPVTAATFVLFQIYIPTPSGTLLNINLADPVVILATALFAITAIHARRLPKWRFPPVNSAVVAATLSLAASLIFGATAFGWTEWALVNRFFGWFILLAYGITGSMIVRKGGEGALRVFLLTYSGATAAIVAIEIFLSILSNIGLAVPVVPQAVEGFALNRNFFVFQILMAISAALISAHGHVLRVTMLTILIAGIWFCGSRSGWISIACVLATSVYLRAVNVREITGAIGYAACFVFIVALLPIMHSVLHGGLVHGGLVQGGLAVPDIVPNPQSTQERMITIIGGLKLFLAHPIFGAGLGAFRNEHILATSGIPLLIHSTALWLLAEMGIVGFLIFTIPAVWLFFSEIRVDHRDIASKMIILSLVVFGVMSTPADMLYQRTFWLIVGAAVALPKLVRPITDPI